MKLKKAVRFPVAAVRVVLSEDARRRLVGFFELLIAIDKRVNPRQYKKEAKSKKVIKGLRKKSAGLVFFSDSFMLMPSFHILALNGIYDRHRGSYFKC